MRNRVIFAKTAAMRYIGHLDLYRAWERLIRRAGLPLAYTQGFSPHPRINLASALPLGCTGEAEMIDIWLENSLAPDEIKAALQNAAPPGLQIEQVEPVVENTPTLQSVLDASEFIITLLDFVPELEQRQEAILSASEIIRTRRGKSYDLRRLILSMQSISPDQASRQRLQACLSARENATGRPDELLDAMGIDPLSARIHRTRLIFQPSISTR